jgi:hypothetical protein
MNSRIIAAIVVLTAPGLFSGCSTAPPDTEKMRLLGQQTFGTDAYLNVIWIPYSGPISSALDTGLGDTSDELAVADSMLAAKSKKVELVIYGDSSSKTASTILRALRNPGLQNGLGQLEVLFVGDAKDAERVRPAIEATGARFFFHQ